MDGFNQGIVQTVCFGVGGKVVLLEKNNVEFFFYAVNFAFFFVFIFFDFGGDGFGSICDFKNLVNVGEVRFDRVRRNVQCFAYFVVCKSLSQ